MGLKILPVDLTSSHLEIARYRAEVASQCVVITKLERELEYLKEELALIRAKFFGRSSEKRAEEASSAHGLLFPTVVPVVETPP